jgi:hypothetical protein
MLILFIWMDAVYHTVTSINTIYIYICVCMNPSMKNAVGPTHLPRILPVLVVHHHYSRTVSMAMGWLRFRSGFSSGALPIAIRI